MCTLSFQKPFILYAIVYKILQSKRYWAQYSIYVIPKGGMQEWYQVIKLVQGDGHNENSN